MSEKEMQDILAVYGDMVYRLALCHTQNTADAEDVYQDVFLRLLKQNSAGWESERLKAWLIRVTLNRCADLGRFRRKRGTLSLTEIPDIACPVDEDLSELWDAAARLPEKLRTVVHLFYAEGYECGEIGALIGVPAATVRSRLRRARTELKRMLGGFKNGESLSGADEKYPYASGSQ